MNAFGLSPYAIFLGSTCYHLQFCSVSTILCVSKALFELSLAYQIAIVCKIEQNVPSTRAVPYIHGSISITDRYGNPELMSLFMPEIRIWLFGNLSRASLLLSLTFLHSIAKKLVSAHYASRLCHCSRSR